MKELKKSRLDSFLINPPKALWTLAIPVMAGMGIQTLYSIVDMIFIGRLGGDSIAAVAFNMPLFFLVLGLTMGLGSGVTASVARYIGAKDKKNADNSAEHAILIGLAISVVLTTFGFLYGQEMLILLGATESIVDLSWSYLKIICFGLPFMVFSAFFRSILAGEGDMKFPMMVAGLGTVLNIIFDPIFIFTLNLGVAGAAVATVISQLIVFAVFVYMLFFKDHAYITFNLKDFTFSKSLLGEIIKIGLPASMSMVIMATGQAVFNKILIYYNAESVAAYQVAGRLDMLVFLPIMAIAYGLTTLVGMFFGAKETDKLKEIVKYGITRSVLITIITSTLVYIFAPILIRTFTPEPIIQSIAIQYLRIMAFAYPFVAVGMTSGRIMQGLGKGLPMLVITVIRVLLVSSLLSLYFAIELNKPVEYVWYAMVIATFISASISLTWVRSVFIKIVNPLEN
ncbi:MAG: MATE family efflux transporter [Candidatus Marinimicrobia bacterium]|nr:MATE family efflux transporter [Candidatus Neomarinimicrobiota bacterium]